MEGLQKQIDNLDEVVTSLDHKVRGNGQPGLVADIASMKTTVEHIEEKLDDLDRRVVQKIGEAIGRERDRVSSSLKDTGKLREIARQVAQEVVREEIAKKADEFNRSMEHTNASFQKAVGELKATLKEKETSPGSWRYFTEKWLIPAGTGVLITLLLQWLSTLLK